MARQGRLHLPHATYFVVNRFKGGLDTLVASPGRSCSGEELHRIAANRERFETLLSYLCRRWCARVQAYCWLPDSTLLLVRIGQPPLECVMHTLRGQYSQHLRERDPRPGPIYAGRYTALLIDPEDYLLDFARHIFWSPVHAGLCRNPLGYEHSSARRCIEDPAPVSLYDSAVSDALRMRGQHSRLGLTRFLTESPTPGFLRLIAHGSRLDRRIAGRSTFVKDVHRSAARQPHAASSDSIISWAASRLSINSAEIVDVSRRAPSVKGRALVAWVATCSGAATLARVARWFGCDPSTLHRALDHYSTADPELFTEQVIAEFTADLEAGDIEDVEAAEKVEPPPSGEG